MNNRKKILLVYPDFFPVNSGHKVHGFNLAKALFKHGFIVYSFNREKDGVTQSVRRSIRCFLKGLILSKYYYIRVSYNFRWVPFFYLARLLRKKIIFELNAPPDELVSYGVMDKTPHELIELDHKLRSFLIRSDFVVNVSKPISDYCTDILKLPADKIVTIENGGEEITFDKNALKHEFINTLEMTNNFKQVLIWSGSINPLQGVSDIESIVLNLPDTSLIIIVSDSDFNKSMVFSKPNVLIFIKPTREELGYLFKKSNVGLALYKDDYSWSRIGFYQSSLKYYEYLANGLVVYCPPLGTMKTRNPNVKNFNNLDELLKLINRQEEHVISDYPIRTWAGVRNELTGILE